MKKTKIVCTIGPKSESVEMLGKLLDAGMNMMRMNFSHGDYEEHGNRIKNLRQVMAETGKRAAIVLDTKGPEIRTIKLVNGEDVKIVAGQNFTFTTDKTVIGDATRVAVTYEGFTSDLKAGDTVLVDDGLLEFTVTEVVGNEVRCVAENNGDLGENKGVNLPNVSVNLPALSEKDINDLKFGCEQGIDYVAASFIRKADDVRAVIVIIIQLLYETAIILLLLMDSVGQESRGSPAEMACLCSTRPGASVSGDSYGWEMDLLWVSAVVYLVPVHDLSLGSVGSVS